MRPLVFSMEPFCQAAPGSDRRNPLKKGKRGRTAGAWLQRALFPIAVEVGDDFLPERGVEVTLAAVGEDRDDHAFLQPQRHVEDALQRRAAGVADEDSL